MPNSFSSGGDAAAQADIMRALARTANPDGARNGDEYERIKAERANQNPDSKKEAEQIMADRREQRRPTTVLASGRTADEVSPRPGHMSGAKHTRLASQPGDGEQKTSDSRPVAGVNQRIRRTGTTLASGRTADEVSPRPGHLSDSSHTQLGSAPAAEMPPAVPPRRRRSGTVLASGHTPDEVSPQPGHLPGGSVYTNLGSGGDEDDAPAADDGYVEMPSRQAGIKRTKTVLSSGHSFAEVYTQEGVSPDLDQFLTTDQAVKAAEEGLEAVAQEVMGDAAADSQTALPESPADVPEAVPDAVLEEAPEVTDAGPAVEDTETATGAAEESEMSESEIGDAAGAAADEGAGDATAESAATSVVPRSGLSFSEQIVAAGGSVPGAAELAAVQKGSGRIDDTWSTLSDYEVKCMIDKAILTDGKVRVPDVLIDFFGAEYREKRVVFLFEGREFPSYLESASGEGAYTLTFSRALSRKLMGIFPQYDDFFAQAPSAEKDAAWPYLAIEKLDEGEFAAKLIMPADEALMRKQRLFDFIGPGKSLAGFADSYELLFFKQYLTQADNLWRADVFMVAGGVQQFYKERIASGKAQDPKAVKTLGTMADAGLDAVLDFLMDGPYQTYAADGFIQTSQEGEHFYFAMDRDLMDELSMDDKNTMAALLDEKIDYYFGRLDGPSLQENLGTWLDGYADYFERDFRYSFKDVITEQIPGSIEGLGLIDSRRYKVVGFAGEEDWAEVPWVEILDKQIARLPNTAVAVKYLLSKDSRKLYLALTVGIKQIQNAIIKAGQLDPEENRKAFEMAVSDEVGPQVAQLRSLINPETFSADTDAIDFDDLRFKDAVVFYREYDGAVPAEAILESDLAAMLAVYDTYLHRCVLKDEAAPGPEVPAEPPIKEEVTPDVQTPDDSEETGGLNDVLDASLDDDSVDFDDLDDLDALDDLADLDDFDLADVDEPDDADTSEVTAELETARAALTSETSEPAEADITKAAPQRSDEASAGQLASAEDAAPATFGSSAVEEASANPFDHVISDVMAAAINGKNGEEETRSIAAHDEAQVQQAQTAAEPGPDEAPVVKAPEPQPAMAAQPEASRPSPVVESEAGVRQPPMQMAVPEQPVVNAAAGPVPGGQTPYAQAAVQVVTSGGLTKEDLVAVQKAMLQAQLKAQKAMLKAERRQQLASEKRAKALAPEPRSRADLRTDEAMQETPLDMAGLMRQIAHYISAGGFQCDAGDVTDLFLTLKAGSLALITGGPGIDKAAFVRLFAEAVGADATNGRFKRVPVRPGWENGDGLLGTLGEGGKFVPGAITDVVAAATENPDKPYFVCLDEMTLVPIEKYFSEVLSVMNSARPQNGRLVTDPLLGAEAFGNDAEARDYYGDLTLPDNLFFIGIVSNEEARHGVSKRLIERAAVIELGPQDLSLVPPPAAVPRPYRLKSDCFRRDIFSLSAVVNHRKTITDMVTLLNVINEILRRADAQIGFRVRDEICFFLYYNAEYGLMAPETAIDDTIVQKMIPRIAGTAAEIETVLRELFKICAGTQDDDAIDEPFDPASGLFPKSAAKLAEMAAQLSVSDRASYWKLT
ncbi:MrcB family domain-containing protein [Pseudoramibacter alactolyticus]